MQRAFLALGAMLLVVVHLVAGEGGPLDRFTGKGQPTEPVVTTGARSDSFAPPSPQPTQVALGSSFGIGDYDASDDGSDRSLEDDGGYGEPIMPSAPDSMLAANQPSTKWNVPDGSLTDEQLGVEKPTGLAPV